MQRVQSIARRASRRAFVRSWLSVCGPALLAGSALGLGSVLTDRLIGPGLAWWPFVAAPLAAAVVGTTAWALWRRRGPFAAAVEVDTRLRLRDRLGTGLALSHEGAREDPFVAMSLAEADAAAERVDLRKAIPLKLGNSWLAWPALACIAGVSGVYLEPMRLLERREAEALVSFTSEQRTSAERALEEASQQISSAPQSPDSEANAALDPQREALDLLKKQLAEGLKSPDEALAGAAGLLDEEAAEAEVQAQRKQAAADAARQALAAVPPDPQSDSVSAQPSSGADPAALREALRRGDPEQAAQTLRELREQLERMPPRERQETARELDRLANDLQSAADQQEKRAQDELDRQRQSLQDMGLTPEEAEQLLDETDPAALEERLRERGVDEETARETADELARQNAERAANREASERAERLSEAAKQAAEEVRSTPSTPGEPEPPDDPATAQGPPQGAEQPPPPQSTDQRELDQKEQDRTGEPRPSPTAPPTTERPGAQEERTQSGPRTGDQQGTQGQEPERRPPGPNPPTPQEPGASPTPQQPAPEQPSQTDERTQQQSSPGDSRQNQGGTPQPSQDPNQPEKPGVQPSGDQPADQKQQKPPQGGMGESPTPDPAAQPNKPQQQPGGDQQGQQPDQQQSSDRDPQSLPGGGQSGEPGVSPSQQPGQSTEGQSQEKGGAGPQQGEQPGGDQSQGGGMQQMEQELRQMAEQSRDAQDQQRRARELREQSRRMLEQASPEQREQMRRWAQQRQEESGGGGGSGLGISQNPVASGSQGGFSTEDVDARRAAEPGAGERVAGEWTDPNQQVQRGGAASTREIADTLRQATRSAEQAVEDQSVPARYRNVREYFRKALERAEREAKQAAPAPAAPDAGASEKKE